MLPFSAFAKPLRMAFLLLSPRNLGLLGRRLLSGWGYFPFLRALLSGWLPFLPFLFCCFQRRGIRWNKSRWPRNNRHYEGISPNMGSEQCKKFGHFFLKHHPFRNISDLLAGVDLSSETRTTTRLGRFFSVSSVKHIKIFLYVSLDRFRGWFFPLLVRGDHLLVGVKKLSHKLSR